MLKLTRKEKSLLQSMAKGSMLRSHRDLEGNKSYQLHALDGSQRSVKYKSVEKLTLAQYIISNQKFPVATYSLTQKGRNAI